MLHAHKIDPVKELKIHDMCMILHAKYMRTVLDPSM